MHSFEKLYMYGNSIVNGKTDDPKEDRHISNKHYTDYWDTMIDTPGTNNSKGYVPIPIGGLDETAGVIIGRKIKDILDIAFFPKVNPIFKDGEVEITNNAPIVVPAGVVTNLSLQVHNTLNDVDHIISPIQAIHQNAGENFTTITDTKIYDPGIETIRDIDVTNFTPSSGKNIVKVSVMHTGITKTKENNYYEQISAHSTLQIDHVVEAEIIVQGNLPVMVYATENMDETLDTIYLMDTMYKHATSKFYKLDFENELKDLEYTFKVDASQNPKKLFILIPPTTNKVVDSFSIMGAFNISPAFVQTSKSLYYKDGYIGRIDYRLYTGVMGDRGFDNSQYITIKRLALDY